MRFSLRRKTKKLELPIKKLEPPEYCGMCATRVRLKKTDKPVKTFTGEWVNWRKYCPKCHVFVGRTVPPGFFDGT